MHTTPKLTVDSDCPKCGHISKRQIELMLAHKRGGHTCPACGMEYDESYRIWATCNTFPKAAVRD